MEKRVVSGAWYSLAWSALFQCLLWAVILFSDFFRDRPRESSSMIDLLLRSGMYLLLFGSWAASFIHAWRHLWHPVTEENGRWVFRRREEVLALDSSSFLSLFPYGRYGLIVLRLRDSVGRHRLIMFMPSRSYQTETGRSVQEVIDEAIATAKKARFREAHGNPGGVTAPKATKACTISSRYTEWIRLGIPWIGGLALMSWVAYDWSRMALGDNWSIARVVIPSLVGLVGFILWKEFLVNLVTRVEDLGNALRIRYRGRETTVALEGIDRIDYRPLQGMHWIVIHFKKGEAIGQKLAFIPRGKGSVEGWSAELDSLSERLEQVEFLERWGEPQT